jgi:hypothetical protein
MKAKFLSFCIIILIFQFINVNFVRSENSFGIEENEFDDEADEFLKARNYVALRDKIINSPGPSAIYALDWGKSRTAAGKSLIVPLLYSTKLWLVGSANPSYSNLRETAALIATYAFFVTLADGTKCGDPSAVEHRIISIITQYQDLFYLLANLPVVQRDKLVNIAILMESRTAEKRENDNYLCRFGSQETAHSLKLNNGNPLEQLPSQPGQVGKNFALPDDPNYEPSYLPQNQWQPKQEKIRSTFPLIMTKILDKIKNSPKTSESNR